MSLNKSIAAVAVMAASLLFTASASALDFQQPGGPYQAGSADMQSIAVGDVNEDGRDDVITVNYSPNSFSVMLAGPSGGLSAPTNYPCGVIPYSVALGDLDDDGHLDVVAAGNDTLMFFPGNGNGTFGPVTTSPATGYSGIAVEVGQFGGSSNLDVVMGDYTGNKVGLFLGNGAGSLVPNGSSASGSKPTGIAVGDFNEDGIDDFATANYGSFFSGAVTVALGAADGSLTAGPGSPLDGDYQPRDVTSGDFNGDGHLDLALVNSPNQSLSVKIGDGSGGFVDAPSLPAIPSHWGESIAAADFDGDGFDDFGVTYDYSTGVFLGNATGDMTQAPGSPWSTTPPASAWFLEAGDFNGDGLPDYVTGDLSGRVSVFINAVARLTADPASLDFGSLPIGTGPSTSQETELTSSGNIAVTVEEGGVSLDGADAAQFQIVSEDCDGETLDPHQSCTVEVAFDPTTAGPKSATLEVASDGDGSPTQVALSGEGVTVPKADLSPASHDFGSVKIGTGPSMPEAFTLTNSGTATLNLVSFDLDGSAADEFDLDASDCPAELEVDDSCDIDVWFEPTEVGPASAQLQIASDDPEGAALADLSGEGELNPGISVAPASHEFGPVTVGFGPSTAQQFTVTSAGSTDLTVEDVQITGANPGQFQIDSDGCSEETIAPEDDCTVAVVFDPTSVGAKTASLSISSDAPASPAEAELSGTGVANPGISIDPPDHDFGDVPVGEGGTLGGPATFTVESEGTTDLSIGVVELSGANPDQFDITSEDCSDQVLPPDATCQVEVKFLPGSIGPKSAELAITNDASESPDTASLNGTGTADPEFSVEPSSHDFGTSLTDAGFGDPVPFTLTNEGYTENEVVSVGLGGADASAYRISDDGCTGTVMGPDASCTVNVEFGPATAGEKNATLELALGSGGGTETAALSGAGEEPVPPPEPCEPVTVKRVAYFTPKVKKKAMYPGVRARIETEKPAVVRLSSKVIYRVKGKQRSFTSGRRQLSIRKDFVNYKVAIPRKLRKKIKPRSKVRFVIDYASRSSDPQCTKFGETKTRTLTTRVVWIRPN